ncbi:Ubiquitin carboxyl-terminal hydrolase CYLD [Nymphon striatum]|nr:Ubiquitin carboxyl-terminal hydrolase CYLD [Nymphon striatum]
MLWNQKIANLFVAEATMAKLNRMEDNPVGVGTGNYKEHQLFLTQPLHAAIVPINGLMKADDFGEDSQKAKPFDDNDSGSSSRGHKNRIQKIDPSDAVYHEDAPSAMFVPHEDHPLSRSTCQENSTRVVPILRNPESRSVNTPARAMNHHSAACCSCQCSWLFSPIKPKPHPFFFFDPFCRDLLRCRCLMNCSFGNRKYSMMCDEDCPQTVFLLANTLKDSLPYLPPAMHQSRSRDVDSRNLIMNHYTTYSPMASSATLPGYDSEKCNTCDENIRDNSSAMRPPIYTSVARPSCNHVSNYNDKKTLSESTLVDVPFHNAMVHNHRHPSDFCSTLPSYSSQTVYPTTESDCGTSHSLNRRYSSRDNSNNTLTSTGCYNSNSLNHFSSDQCSPCHDSDLVTSCAEMDSGSFYHVVPDDCVDRINSMKKNGDLTGNVKDILKNENYFYFLKGINHSPNSTIRCLDLPYEEGHDKSYDDSLDIGSVVEIIIKGEPNYGVIKWIGTIPEYQNGQKKIAGIELASCTDGALNGRRLFECPPRKGFFVQLNKCLKDSRFTESDSILDRSSSAEFGSMDCPVVSGDVSPLSQPEDISTICGKYRGIQGHHNSCYLDATLFSMFSFTPVFDCILHRPYTKNDINQYTKVQQVLKEEIVNPLRRYDVNLFIMCVCVIFTDNIIEDKQHSNLPVLSEIYMSEQTVSGQESYFYQLFVEKDEKIVLPTVQQLFDQSFLASDIKLKEILPIIHAGEKCLIHLNRLQILCTACNAAPRHCHHDRPYILAKSIYFLKVSVSLMWCLGGSFMFADTNAKIWEAIQDNAFIWEQVTLILLLIFLIKIYILPVLFSTRCTRRVPFNRVASDATAIHMDHVPNIFLLSNYTCQCDNAQTLAIIYKLPVLAFLESLKTFNAFYSSTSVQYMWTGSRDHTPIPRIFMELFAVVCIETSHYVAFVKCGTGPDAPWCFFDSMADRRGEQNGYNIPEVVPFKDLKWWLSEEGFNFLLSTKDDKNLPEMPKRLLCDAYMCFYQSPDVMMYR